MNLFKNSAISDGFLSMSVIIACYSVNRKIQKIIYRTVVEDNTICYYYIMLTTINTHSLKGVTYLCII